MPSVYKNWDIEALRVYALAITFVAHLGALIPHWQDPLGYFWLGGGVDLFFAISGFIITRSLMETLKQGVPFRDFATRFWVRRIFRLWPAAILWASISAVISILWLYETDVHRRILIDWAAAVLNVQNLHIVWCFDSPSCAYITHGYYWTLSLEEQFYAVVPIVLYLCGKRMALIGALAMLAVLQSFAIRPFGSLLWFLRTDALLYGVIVALAWHHFRPLMQHAFDAVPRWTLQCAIAGLAIGVVVLSRPSGSPYYMGLVAICAGLMVLALSADRALITQPGSSRQLASYLGSRSYAFYLTHVIVLRSLHKAAFSTGILDPTYLPHQCAAVACAALISLALAEASFRVVEEPLRRLGTSITAQRTATA